MAALLAMLTVPTLVVIGTPALAFAILGELAGLVSKRYGPGEGFIFGVRLGCRAWVYVAGLYFALYVWAVYPMLAVVGAFALGAGQGFRHNTGLSNRYRRDYRWLRRHTDPEARRIQDAGRRTLDAAGERAKTAGKAAPRYTWRGLRWAGRRTRRAADTDPPSAAGWLFGRHRDGESPGERARRDWVEDRVATRLRERHEPWERTTLDQRLTRWADRLGLHRHDDIP